jgi:hypothetical protein
VKTILIILLTLALAAAAFFTRPSQADFDAYVKSQLPDQPRGFWDKVLNKKPASERFLDGCAFKDRFVYVQVEKDGQVIYTGAFDHFFAHGTPIVKTKQDEQDDPKRSDDNPKSVVTQTE